MLKGHRLTDRQETALPETALPHSRELSPEEPFMSVCQLLCQKNNEIFPMYVLARRLSYA